MGMPPSPDEGPSMPKSSTTASLVGDAKFTAALAPCRCTPGKSAIWLPDHSRTARIRWHLALLCCVPSVAVWKVHSYTHPSMDVAPDRLHLDRIRWPKLANLAILTSSRDSLATNIRIFSPTTPSSLHCERLIAWSPLAQGAAFTGPRRPRGKPELQGVLVEAGQALVLVCSSLQPCRMQQLASCPGPGRRRRAHLGRRRASKSTASASCS